jgi:restriction system protein
LDYANNLTGLSVVLIDGEQLAKFMIDKKVGVATERSFEVMGIDENFFGEDLL